MTDRRIMFDESGNQKVRVCRGGVAPDESKKPKRAQRSERSHHAVHGDDGRGTLQARVLQNQRHHELNQSKKNQDEICRAHAAK